MRIVGIYASWFRTLAGINRKMFSRSSDIGIILKQVIVYAALYLRLRRSQDSEGNRDKDAARIAEFLYPGSTGKIIKESCIQFLLNYKRDLIEVIFVKPLHVRIKLHSLDHPKADNSKGIILTDSSVEVNVLLGS